MRWREAGPGIRGSSSGRGRLGQLVSGSENSSVAVTWNWSWEGIKPSYGRGEGHPLPNCDLGENVSPGERACQCLAPRWGITDAGSRRPLSQRSSSPSSGGEQDS